MSPTHGAQKLKKMGETHMKTKMRTALMLVVMLVAATAAPAQDEPGVAQLGERFMRLINSKPLRAGADEDELVKLLKARHNIALEGLKESYRDFSKHVVQTDVVFDAARRLVDTRLDLASTSAEKLEVYDQVHAILLELETIYKQRTKMLGGGESDLIRIQFARLTTEVDMLKTKRAAMKTSKASPESN
jgi:hypothetical protein